MTRGFLRVVRWAALGSLAIGCSADPSVKLLSVVESIARAELSTDASPRVGSSEGFLFLPSGSSVKLAFRAPADAELRIERVAVRGRESSLTVELESDASPEIFRELVARTERDVRFELPTTAEEAVRIRLSAIASESVEGDGVLLTGPAIWGRMPQAPPPAPASPRERPDIVIYLIDTLRRDRLGAYGYDRPVSPRIDEFAATSTLFEAGVAQSSWTKASVASMWTGVWPPSHGTYGWSHRMPESAHLLPEHLREAGYETAAFLTNVSSSPAFGLAQGFDHVWYHKKRRSDLVTEEVLSWLDAREGSRPLFLFVHTMDPHAGYNPVEPFRSRFAPGVGDLGRSRARWRWPIEDLPALSALYDGEIAQNDDAFGKLMSALRERRLFDDSMILLLSDHGEEFKEHGGWRHGRVLHAESVNVPFILKLPGQRSGVRSRLAASHVDVLPTIFELVGLEVPPAVEGQSLLAPQWRPAFSHLRLGRAPLQYAVVDRQWKLIRVEGQRAKTRLYDLSVDPGEENDLSAELPVRRAVLEGLLREHLALTSASDGEEIELTDDLRESMRALGYLR